MANYRQRTITAFKHIFSRSEYEFEPKLDVLVIHREIKKKFRIGDKKIGDYLGKYKIKENEDINYKNPFMWPIFSSLPYYFSGDFATPASIDYNEELQREYGRTLDEASELIEKKCDKKIPTNVLRSWIEIEYSGKIKEGADGYWYVSPD